MNHSRISYSVQEHSFSAELVFGDSRDELRPGVLVLHGGGGPGAHERARAEMLAALGYVALVPDLFGETFSDRAAAIAAITRLVEEPTRLRARVVAALERLHREPGVDSERVAAVGFCFGGLAALELARSGADLGAVVSFHGGLHTRGPARAGELRARVLACTGSADPFVTRDHRAAFEEEMRDAGGDWQLQLFGGAEHGFTEQLVGRPGCAYHASADRRSWSAMRALLDESFALAPTSGARSSTT